MRSLAERALDAAMVHGVTYADVRTEDILERHISTKNGKPSNFSTTQSLGLGIRVIAEGCWGFAATDDLSGSGIEKAARLAVEIARSGKLAKKYDVVLAPEDAYQATWSSPCRIDPFAIPVERQLEHLLAVDAELRHTQGITLAETSLNCVRKRQYFASSIGSRIDQTRTITGAGFTAISFKDG